MENITSNNNKVITLETAKLMYDTFGLPFFEYKHPSDIVYETKEFEDKVNNYKQAKMELMAFLEEIK